MHYTLNARGLSLLILSLVINAQGFSQSFEQIYQKAELAYQQAQYDSAAILFREVREYNRNRDTLYWATKGLIKSVTMLAGYDEAMRLIDNTLLDTEEKKSEMLILKSKVAFRLGEYDSARQLNDSAYTISTKTEGLELFAASALNQIAKYHVWHSENEEADSVNTSALNWYERSTRKDYLLRGDISNIFALSLYLDGKFEEAISYLEEAIAFKLKVYPAAHPLIVALYSNIGVMYRNMLQYDRALGYFEYALNLEKEILGPDNPRLATTYTNIGSSYANKGNFKQGIAAHKKALSLRLKLGEQHPKTLDSYEWLGELAVAEDQFDQAEGYFLKVLKGRVKNFGLYNNHVGYAYLNLGDLYIGQENPTKALAQYKMAEKISDEVHPELNYDRADVHLRMGNAYFRTDHIDSARVHFIASLVANIPGFQWDEEDPQEPDRFSYLKFDIMINAFIGLAKTYIHEHSRDLILAGQILDTARKLISGYQNSFTNEQDRISLAKVNKGLKRGSN